MAPIQFGILLIPFQVLDVVGPVDILSSSSITYLKKNQEHIGEPLEFANRGLDIQFHYIGDTMDGITGTANCTIKPTTTCATCPKLDYLLIGEPYADLFLNVPDVFANFIRDRVDGLQGLFTTCSVNWSSQQWAVDGKFWTAGGAIAGMDMFENWVTEKCGQDVPETGYLALDFEPRDVNGKPVPLKTSLRINN
ncbi:hypothetical protein GMDG_05211 [Pseudogymnoascus destructans 20631-21]|uniref:Uncharacterized protein n=1 Tax=Pseudogymnoascus destructans (strain ATCC MYA-4855 / 20631-21) TaxID=658429 RepID=L8FND6_PSED2|nr:hypothetical protein GMDG_05211 [Pseudogymnoascus destructans 20631-21]